MRLPDKLAVRRALETALERNLEAMASAARTTREGAIHEDSRAEGDKDMRSTEQSYLARGQAMRVEDLSEQLQRLRATTLAAFDADTAIGVGALVLVEIEDDARAFFVLPFGGGVVLCVDGIELTVVTPSSPVGQALLGKKVDEDFELRQRGALRECVVAAVA
jgi:transcription elongation GreA/GreB family factor